MSENESGQEKTEEPTHRKLEKAKEDGQIPRSKELNTSLLLLAAVLGLMTLGADVVNHMIGVMKFTFTPPREAGFDPQYMLRYLSNSAISMAVSLAPLMAVIAVSALVSPVLLGGWLLSAKSLMPKPSRLNPIKGLGRMFSMNALVELAKALAKFFVIAPMAITVLMIYQTELLSMGASSVQAAIVHSAELLLWIVFLVAASTILIAVVDVPYQLYDNNKKLKMTLQEVKDEMKDSDGKPEVKGRIRQLQYEMAQRRMMESVPEADVVITNPEHFSVALKYDMEGKAAPVVIAKGSEHLALKIREIAKAHEILVMPSPPLARAIFYTTEVDHEIPGNLYLAVAQVLAYVFQLKSYQSGTGKKPKPMADIEIPTDVNYDVDGNISS